MKFEDHCTICQLILGKPYAKVNLWIDELCAKYGGPKHWVYRHHLEAIKKKYKEGSGQFLAAYIHIVCDWLHYVRLPIIPKNAEEVKSELAFLFE